MFAVFVAPCAGEITMEVLVYGVRSICGVVNGSLGSMFIGSVDTGRQPVGE